MLSKVILLGRLVLVAFHQLSTRVRLGVSSRIHRLTYKAVDNPRDIIVIGASFAGYHAAYCLAHSVPSGYRVTVIEKNSHFQLTWVLPRFCAVPGHEYKAFIPYGPYLAQAPEGSYRWCRDEVTEIIPENDGKGRVQLRSGETMDYDYLVLATGSSAKLPSRVGAEEKTEGMEAMQGEQQRFQDGQDIVVIGGGPAGIELAADVKTKYPDKQVTLVHSHATLLNGHFGDTLRQRVLTETESQGVRVILGQRASEGHKEVVLSSGERIPCDCLVKCVGQKPNSQLVTSVSPSGHVEVEDSLQVTGMKHVYAAGDIIDRDIIKNGRSAIEQAQAVARNIVHHIKGEPLELYRPRWWEGATKLTVGLKKNLVYMDDGQADMVIGMQNRREELDSAMVWRFFGTKPFRDEGDNDFESMACAGGAVKN